MDFKSWLTEELKSPEQRSHDEAQADARRKKERDDERERLLVEWCASAFKVFRAALSALSSSGQNVSMAFSSTEPALTWADGRKLEIASKDRFSVELRRENARTVAAVTSTETKGGHPMLVDAIGKPVGDAESFLKLFILAAAKNQP